MEMKINCSKMPIILALMSQLLNVLSDVYGLQGI